ncbi:TlpA family protein disulfide reductase [Sphingobacterium sp. WQ 366]|uniref:TlpA family protein disulfide reductase n=2 Tax=Sphingobacterium bovistauri TaxID=2781959 RepID=A0ABS7Z619_9SPHI|nr:TlpA family protein disulfide reductase [Sphingobacterium bovistauri]
MAQMPSTINGHVNFEKVKKVGLSKILNGRLIEIGTTSVDSSGYFGFRFIPEYEGFYVLNVGAASNQNNLFRFYFKQDQTLNVEFDGSRYSLLGNNSNENKALAVWDKEASVIREKALSLGGNSTFKDFFPEVEALHARLNKLKNINPTGNKRFDSNFGNIVDFDFAYYALTYVFMPKSVHPQKIDFINYYNTFDPDKFLTKDLLNMHYGDRFLSTLIYKKVDLSTKPTYDTMLESIPVAELKGQFALQNLERSKSYDNYLELTEKYQKYFILAEQKARHSTMGAKLIDTKRGVPAYQFKFPDINGNVKSLNDLKGKVVLVDLWATWCGPCRAEEPFWEKLNEEYLGKDVAFVGVSTDKDKGAWEKYVTEKKLKGIQLHAGVANPLSEAYKVTGIPRYILIDKQGNLVSADSPRPSNPSLKTLLDDELKK